MKILIFASILCLTSAELLKRAAPAVDDSTLAFLEGSSETGSLARAIGVDEEWVAHAGEDIKHELKEKVKEVFHEMLQKIKNTIDQGKEIRHELLEKAKEVAGKLKDLGVDLKDTAKEMIGDLKGKTKEIIHRILEDSGLGRRDLNAQMDAIARSKFGDFLQEVIEKITSDESIQKLRDYVKKIASDSELAQGLKQLIEKLEDTDLKQIIRDLLQHKYRISQTDVARGETWDKIKDFFKDLKIKIGDHSEKFGEWVKNTWDKGIGKLKEKYGTIKAIAMEFIADHGEDLTAEIAREALDFFRPHKDDLGSLWEEVVKVAKKVIGKSKK